MRTGDQCVTITLCAATPAFISPFVRNCLRQAAEFKTNFWANVVTNLGWMASLIVLIAIIYRNTDSVAGWNKAEMLVLFGTYTIMRGISNTLFYSNLSQLPTFVRKGTMDWILTKPVNSQFYVSLRYLEFSDLGQSVGGIFILIYGIAKLHLTHSPTPLDSFLFCMMLLSSIVLFYSITLLLMTLVLLADSSRQPDGARRHRFPDRTHSHRHFQRLRPRRQVYPDLRSAPRIHRRNARESPLRPRRPLVHCRALGRRRYRVFHRRRLLLALRRALVCFGK